MCTLNECGKFGKQADLAKYKAGGLSHDAVRHVCCTIVSTNHTVTLVVRDL